MRYNIWLEMHVFGDLRIFHAIHPPIFPNNVQRWTAFPSNGPLSKVGEPNVYSTHIYMMYTIHNIYVPREYHNYNYLEKTES